jgi:hypothetical protein
MLKVHREWLHSYITSITESALMKQQVRLSPPHGYDLLQYDILLYCMILFAIPGSLCHPRCSDSRSLLYSVSVVDVECISCVL